MDYRRYNSGTERGDYLKKINVALFISEFEDTFSDALCNGVIKAVKEHGYNLYVFPGKFLDSRVSLVFNDEYAYQNNCLYQFVSEKNIDVAIVCLGNIGSQLSVKAKKEFVSQMTVPVILVSDIIEGYSSVTYDNTTGMMKGIEHLLRVHHKRHFGYVSGPKSNIDAVERQQVFEQVMWNNGISPADYRIVEGDFSYTSSAVIEQLLDSYPNMDAMICANDMMCYSAYQVLEARGMKVGRDIALLGFDDSPYSGLIKPGLSTVKADPGLLGYKAVELCESAIRGEVKQLAVETSVVLRGSCGCEEEEEDKESVDVLNVQAKLDSLNHTLVAISRNVLNYEEENEEIYSAILNSLCKIDVQGVYLYTFLEEQEYKKGETWKRPEFVKLRTYYQEPYARDPDIEYQPMPVYYYPVAPGDVKEVQSLEQRIAFDEIFNNRFMRIGDLDIKVVTMLYAGEAQYGFMIWNIKPEYYAYISQLSYQVSNVLKMNRLLYKKNQMATALEESLQQVREKNMILEEISKVDELTQVYNRRGFLNSMKRNVILKENRGRNVIAVYADMNNLKLVNDQFGHEEGDYALRMIGQILRDAIHSVPGTGEVGRVGGDEFCGFLITDWEDGESALRTRIDEITERVNNESDKPYYVSMSVGMQSFICSEDVNISNELEQADIDLYVYKKKKRTNILKNN